MAVDASRKRLQRPTMERMPKAHILVTILFTSLAWVVLDLILFATQTDGPSTSGKLPILDVPHKRARRADVPLDQVPHDQVKMANSEGHQEEVLRFKEGPVHDMDLGIQREAKLKQWRHNMKVKDTQGSLRDAAENHPDRHHDGGGGEDEHGAEHLGPEVPDADVKANLEPHDGVNHGRVAGGIKVENETLVGKHILPDKPDERPKSFKELHQEVHIPTTTTTTTTPGPTTTTTVAKMGDVNKFMKNWREEKFDNNDIMRHNKHRAEVDALMNKIGHNAKAILDRKEEDIIQFDNPWVKFGDDKPVPTEKPLVRETTTTQKPRVIETTTTRPVETTTEQLNFTLIHNLDVTSQPRTPNGPGEQGAPVILSKAEKAISQKTWARNHFSVYVSDKISLERGLKDPRPRECKTERFPYRHLPRTSIVICFTDEAWSTLLRSVHSVLNRSPPELVEEVILVDDFSQREHLKQKLDDYIKNYPKVKVLRMPRREGLIRARLAAVEIARAPVITFLDSHIECCVGWLEPLLERIRLNPRAVPCPVIDTISDHNLNYIAADAKIRGGFTWAGLMFRWSGVPPYEKKRLNSTTDAVRSPTMAGGLFSIRKDYFYELGTYDPGLQIWGGENLELSFKVWLCGGMVEICPCSHVGHIFRSKQPYNFPGTDNVSAFLKNSLRVATVWLDDYIESFYAVNPALKKISPGNITDRLAIKTRLKCHNFDWYLKNVYPELFVPGMKLKARGQMVNSWTKACFDVKGGTPALNAGVGGCHGLGGNQVLRLTVNHSLENFDKCIGAPSITAIRLIDCTYPDQIKWQHTKGGQVKDMGRNLCLEVKMDGRNLHLAVCDETNIRQQWTFDEYL